MSKVNIKRASQLGFCYGLRKIWKKIDIILNENQDFETIYLLRPLVHNHQVTQRLKERGIVVVSDISQVPNGAMTIVGPHSVTFQELEQLKEKARLIDTTCDRVKRVFETSIKLSEKCDHVIFVGDKNHTEANTLKDLLHNLIILQDEKEINQAFLKGTIGMVSQSTFSIKRYRNIVFHTKKYCQNLKVKWTCCRSVTERIRASIRLAKNVDLMIVIGGHHSHNTKHLSEICRALVETKHIETEEDINPCWLPKQINKIGIGAGASTPDWIINKVEKRIKEIVA